MLLFQACLVNTPQPSGQNVDAGTLTLGFLQAALELPTSWFRGAVVDLVDTRYNVTLPR